VEIMHGDADDVVPVGNSQLFIAQLIEARPAGGEPQCLLHNLPGGDHRVSSPQALQLMLQLIVRMMKDESTMCSDASIPGSHIA
jgi:dipeptidyl aminopeptidase/acylaminoacyl peptidase